MHPPPPESNDLNTYALQLQQRMRHLEGELSKLAAEEHMREEQLEETHISLRQEVRQLSEDVQRVNDHLMQLVKQTEKLVGQFKGAARRQKYDVLKQRVDAWKGETFVRRDEFKRWLEE